MFENSFDKYKVGSAICLLDNNVVSNCFNHYTY